MTGKDLIIYILQNNLVDKDISEISSYFKTISVEEAAIRYDVGTATIKSAFDMGLIDGFQINGQLYILDDDHISEECKNVK